MQFAETLVILCCTFSSPVFFKVVDRFIPRWVVEFTCANLVPFSSNSVCSLLDVFVGVTVTKHSLPVGNQTSPKLKSPGTLTA